MSDIQVNQREFVRHFSKYLKEGGRYCVHGREDYVVEIGRGSFPGAKSEIDTSGLTKKLVFDEYGCGCKKLVGDAVCKKHGRY